CRADRGSYYDMDNTRVYGREDAPVWGVGPHDRQARSRAGRVYRGYAQAPLGSTRTCPGWGYKRRQDRPQHPIRGWFHSRALVLSSFGSSSYVELRCPLARTIFRVRILLRVASYWFVSDSSLSRGGTIYAQRTEGKPEQYVT